METGLSGARNGGTRRRNWKRMTTLVASEVGSLDRLIFEERGVKTVYSLNTDAEMKR